MLLGSASSCAKAAVAKESDTTTDKSADTNFFSFSSSSYLIKMGYFTILKQIRDRWNCIYKDKYGKMIKYLVMT